MASKDQQLITEYLKDIGLPNTDFVFEYHLGESLRYDIYMPAYRVAIEYHGRQHFEYVDHFHKSKEGFLDAIQRDFRKAELSREHGVNLVVFTYKDKITKELVYERVMDAMIHPIDEPVQELTWEEQMKEKSKRLRRERYRELKERNRRK